MTNKDDMYDKFKALFDENKIDMPHVIMHPRWRNTVENNRYSGVSDEGAPELLGMDVHYSPFVEEGQVFLMSQPRRFGFGFGKLPEISPELHQRLQEQLERYLSSALLYGHRAESEWQGKYTYNWHRFPDETLLAWGERLSSKALLDNPAIRWEYQKAILGAPFEKLKALWLKS